MPLDGCLQTTGEADARTGVDTHQGKRANPGWLQGTGQRVCARQARFSNILAAQAPALSA
jgi:hypothetical protein